MRSRILRNESKTKKQRGENNATCPWEWVRQWEFQTERNFLEPIHRLTKTDPEINAFGDGIGKSVG